MKLIENTILVTGATSGIGRDLAIHLAGLGNRVIAVGRDLERLAKLEEFKNVVPIAMDLMSMEEIETLVLHLLRAFPDLNILVNNAGVQYNYELPSECSPIPKIEIETTINFLAPIRLTTLLLPHLMVQPRAMIVNVTSFLAQVPKQEAAVYCATKAALRSFSKALRYQLEESSVEVLEVIPPVVDTPMTAGRNTMKISSHRVALEIADAIGKGETERYIGPVKLAKRIHRFIPSLIEKKIRHS